MVHLLLVVWLFAQTADAGADSLSTLSDLIAEAKRENLELRAMRAELDAAGYGTSWLRHVPDPMVAFEFSDNMTMFSVTQQIPFPTKISKRADRARLVVDHSILLYEDREQRLVKAVKESYAAFLLLKGRISATEKSLAFLRQIYSAARQKYSINEASQSELLIAQVELARAENQLMSLNDDLSIAKADLNTLLNRDVDQDLPVLAIHGGHVDTLSLPALYELAKENQPKLKAFELKREEARLALSIAEQTYLPDLTFRYSREMMDNDVFNSKYMIGFSLPVWFLGKQREMVREASSMLNGAGAQYEMVEKVVLLDVKEARTRVEKYRRTVDLYEKSVVPQAMTALKSAVAAYELNRIDFQIVLESEKSLVQVEYDHEEAQAMLFMAIAELERAIGLSD